MILTEALDAFKSLELKMSEVYLWCSIHFDDIELRQFFSDMSDEELSHARALENLAKVKEISSAAIEIPDDLPKNISNNLAKIFDLIKKRQDINGIFLLLADMESTEINLAFDSILQGIKDAKIPRIDFLNTSTRRHILMLADRAEKLNLEDEVRKKIDGIYVTDRDFFKLFIR